ncbi:MAG: putative phosphocarrier proteinhPr [Pseudomonadota bacterium]
MADPQEPAGSPGTAPVLTDVLEIRNRRGLHARAAAKFVKTAAEFDAEVAVERGDYQVSGQSIMGLMMLAAALGTSITVTTSGRQAAEALAAIRNLVVDRKFDED